MRTLGTCSTRITLEKSKGCGVWGSIYPKEVKRLTFTIIVRINFLIPLGWAKEEVLLVGEEKKAIFYYSFECGHLRSLLQLSSTVTVSSSLLYVFLITLLIHECRLFVVTSPYFLPLGIPQLAPYLSFSLLFLNYFLRQNLSTFFQ